MAIPAVDLTSRCFGRLTIVRRTSNRWGCVRWICRCSCGRRTVACSSKLKGGLSLSCGCLRYDRVTKHGATRNGKCTREYRSWQALIRRCVDPKRGYIARGIRVAAEWRKDFSSFFRHIGPSPGAKYTVERIDNDKGYFPGNVRWATAKEQAANRRNSRKLTIGGVTKNLGQWSERTGIKFTTIWERLRRGWSAKRAVFTPVGT